MQTFAEVTATARQKAGRASAKECRGALADIKATLEIYRDCDPKTHEYARKLWTEFDAYGERLAKLDKRR